ncbi:MAG: Na+-transporting oxaloacetate decarboxylase beta subunit [Clostridia bacterium]|nr:Na+-transporting oxaloacetate decarboxylase beta subunit [Clostridia bacterium]
MKKKRLYINRYNFYAFNCSLLIWAIVFLALIIIPILSIDLRSAASVGIIGAADGPTAIYVTAKIISLPLWVALIGMIALWVMLFINYAKDKDKIKDVSMKRIVVCAFLSVALIVVTGNWFLGLWALSLGIIMLVLWNSKKFEVWDKEEVK